MACRTISAADVARANLRKSVKLRLNRLALELSDEEIGFMDRLVNSYDGDGWIRNPLGIVNAFEAIVRERGEFVLVETRVEADAVRAFLEEFRSAPKHLVPRGNGWYLYCNPACDEKGQEG